jgi:hypothetical protein
MSKKKKPLPMQRRKNADHAGTRTKRVSRSRQRAVRRRVR